MLIIPKACETTEKNVNTGLSEKGKAISYKTLSFSEKYTFHSQNIFSLSNTLCLSQTKKKKKSRRAKLLIFNAIPGISTWASWIFKIIFATLNCYTSPFQFKNFRYLPRYCSI